MKRGFTLIELLVVIAIIGLLSSVVVASLNSARGKGADVAIKSNLANIRAQAEILYDKNGSYDIDTTPTNVAAAACGSAANSLFADPTVLGMITSADSAGGICAGAVTTENSATAAGWAVAVQLKVDATKGWCVDWTGASKEVDPASDDQAGYNGIVTDGEC